MCSTRCLKGFDKTNKTTHIPQNIQKKGGGNSLSLLFTNISVILFITLFFAIGCGGGNEDAPSNNPQNGDVNMPVDGDNSGNENNPDDGNNPVEGDNSGNENNPDDGNNPVEGETPAEGDIVVSKTSLGLFTSSGKTTEDFTVSLTHAPTADVVISIGVSNANAGQVSSESLVFTPDNWQTEQTVTFTGAFGEQAISATIALAVTSNTPGYQAKTASIEIVLCAASEHDNGLGACASGTTCATDYAFKNGVCEDMFVSIPGGTYTPTLAGSTPVTLKPFRISKTETTVAQYYIFDESGTSQIGDFDISSNNSRCNYTPDDIEDKKDHPMNCVSWYGANNYCAWIGGRLPTVQEWEYAAMHDGTQARQIMYPWGDDTPDDPEIRMNTAEASIFATTPVGYYSPLGDSLLGLQDMGGNLSEWTVDVFEYSTDIIYYLKGENWNEYWGGIKYYTASTANRLHAA